MKRFTLAGVPVTPSEYQRLKFVITTEEQSGWKPTKQDIEDLIKSDRKPSPEIKHDVDKMAEDVKRDE